MTTVGPGSHPASLSSARALTPLLDPHRQHEYRTTTRPASRHKISCAIAILEPVAAQAARLVLRFHNILHGVVEQMPQSKELNHAITLIANHGIETAEYIIDLFFPEPGEEAMLLSYRPYT